MTAHASKGKLLTAFAAIYFIWGSTFLFIKFAIESIPPFMMGAMRFWLAAAILYVWARATGAGKPERKHWREGLILGVFLLGAGNGGVVWSQQRVASGIAALMVAIVPLLVVLIEWLRPGGRRPATAAIIGVLIGLAGMALLIGPSALLGTGDIDPTASLVLLLGSTSWSVATVYGKGVAVPDSPPMATAIQLAGGALALTVVSLIAGEPWRVEFGDITIRGWLSLAYLVTFGSVIAYSAFSWLMRVAEPTRVSTYAYVNPIVAMLLGWAVADEEMSARVLIAASIVLLGVVLITRRRE